MPGLLRAVGRTAVIAGTATTVSNRVSRRQARKWSAEEEQQQPQQQQEPQYYEPAPAPAAAPPEESRLDKLTQLAQLKDTGVLTEAEFAVEKARILQN